MSQLPLEYIDALKGLQGQAAYALESVLDKSPDKSNLSKAQQLMSENQRAVKDIIKAVHDRETTIPEITEEWLYEWLLDTKNLSLSFLWEKPLYFAACNKVGDKDYYFITTYFNDVQACGGHSQVKEEVEKMMDIAASPYKLNYIDEMPVELKQSLKMPSSAFSFAFLTE